MNAIDTIFYVVVLIMSVVIHEVSHGYMALYYGDLTAKHAGRLTLNPLKHLDPVGSIVIPLILIVSKAGFIFGWAKPVPYNPSNLRDQKWGTVAVAAAGIVVNLLMAIIFGLIIRGAIYFGFSSEPFLFITSTIVFVNIVLAIFNLIPIPPLDGSKILFKLLPYRFSYIESFCEKYAIALLLFFIFFLWEFITPVIYILFRLFTGMVL